MGHYAVKYPQHVRKMMLMSPLGIGHHSEEELSKFDNFSHYSIKGRKPLAIARHAFNYNLMVTKILPNSINRRLPFALNKKLYRNVAKKKFKVFTEPGITYVADYLCQIHLMESGFDHALYKVKV